jgi:signal transduction histidine kinase
MAATVVFGVVVSGGDGWPIAVLAAFLAVGADCLVNYGTVVAVLCLHERITPWDGLSRLYFGSLPEFALTYASFGLLSLMLAEILQVRGGVESRGVCDSTFACSSSVCCHKRLASAVRRLDIQAEALRDVAASVADERREERLSLAAGLHDEVLPPLYKVHLMGQVLRQDLASGPPPSSRRGSAALLGATDNASDSTRELIRGLRDSPLVREVCPRRLGSWCGIWNVSQRRESASVVNESVARP